MPSVQVERPQRRARLLLTHWFRVRPPGAPRARMPLSILVPWTDVCTPVFTAASWPALRSDIKQLPNGSWRAKAQAGTDPLTGGRSGCGGYVKLSGPPRSSSPRCSSRRQLAIKLLTVSRRPLPATAPEDVARVIAES